MIKFRENVMNSIDPEAIKFVKENQGFLLPRDLKLPEGIKENDITEDGWTLNADELQWYATGSYKTTQVNMEGFDGNNCPYDFGKDLLLDGDYCEWLVVKMHPGQYMPWHRDLTPAQKGCTTHWIMLTDWEPGHLFVIEKETISHYKAGDAYTFQDSFAWHTGCNIGYSTRINLQIRTYKL